MGGDLHKKKKKHSGDEYHYRGKCNRVEAASER